MSHRFNVRLEIFPDNGEHPTMWLPRMPPEAALALLDDSIRSAEGHLKHLREMRALIDATRERGGSDG